MKIFTDFFSEHAAAHYFDIDGTTFDPSYGPNAVRVQVYDANGNHIKSLTPYEYTTYKKEPGHHLDFSEFSSAKKFAESRPIRKIIAKVKLLQHTGGDAQFLTARPDLDDKQTFADHFKKYGIDINKIHVRRAGNLDMPTPEAKKKIVSDQIKERGLTSVHLYDDDEANLDSFLSLKKENPKVKFTAHHVHHNSETGKTTITIKRI